MVEQLGLGLIEEIVVSTASGPMTTRRFGGALVAIGGRRATVDCIELARGCRPLLGAIPMENLGIELDLKNRRLRFLPDSGPDTYLTA